MLIHSINVSEHTDLAIDGILLDGSLQTEFFRKRGLIKRSCVTKLKRILQYLAYSQTYQVQLAVVDL